MDQGKTWTNVTNIPNLPSRVTFNTIEAGPDVNTAFVAARMGPERGQNAAPPDDNTDTNAPLIWRTTDAVGKTWTSIVNGLPRDGKRTAGSWINSLRVDPEQPELALRRIRDHGVCQLR